jgi:hypothetical protein
MSALNQEKVLSVRHWNDSLFSFTTTRNTGFRFRNGHFVMIGLEVEGKPLLRAFSVVSPNYDEHLEFYSIKMPDGALTSRLQHITPGDQVLVSRKPTGTLCWSTTCCPGKRLYLLATGTGLAPFMSIIRDPGDLRALPARGGGPRRAPGERPRATAATSRRSCPPTSWSGELVQSSCSTTPPSPASPSATRAPQQLRRQRQADERPGPARLWTPSTTG